MKPSSDLTQLLYDLEEYFDNRADVDDGMPSAEMRLLVAVRTELSRMSLSNQVRPGDRLVFTFILLPCREVMGTVIEVSPAGVRIEWDDDFRSNYPHDTDVWKQIRRAG